MTSEAQIIPFECDCCARPSKHSGIVLCRDCLALEAIGGLDLVQEVRGIR